MDSNGCAGNLQLAKDLVLSKDARVECSPIKTHCARHLCRPDNVFRTLYIHVEARYTMSSCGEKENDCSSVVTRVVAAVSPRPRGPLPALGTAPLQASSLLWSENRESNECVVLSALPEFRKIHGSCLARRLDASKSWKDDLLLASSRLTRQRRRAHLARQRFTPWSNAHSSAWQHRCSS